MAIKLELEPDELGLILSKLNGQPTVTVQDSARVVTLWNKLQTVIAAQQAIAGNGAAPVAQPAKVAP